MADSRMCSRLFSGSAAMPTRPSRPETAAEIRSRVAPASLPAGGGANERRIESGRPGGAAGRVDRDVHRFAEAADAVAVLAPFGEAVLPGLGRLRGERLRRRALARGFRRVDPGLELRGRQAGESQHQVRNVAFRVDDERRECRRAPLPRGARCRGPSCRCRSCRRRPRASSGRASRTSAGRRRAGPWRRRSRGRGRTRPVFRSRPRRDYTRAGTVLLWPSPCVRTSNLSATNRPGPGATWSWTRRRASPRSWTRCSISTRNPARAR